MEKSNKQKQATVLTAKKFKGLRHPLPKSLIECAGLLKHKRLALESHLKKARDEWARFP
ncbi:MAG: hypothetical protein HY562_05545 [Ignavibacteriales bacterium]|nr:hypothetical protein [Ignavibacteriales bacterium]